VPYYTLKRKIEMKYRNCEIRISQSYNILIVQAFKDKNPFSCEYSCSIIDSIDFEKEKGQSVLSSFIRMVKEDIDNNLLPKQIKVR